MTTPQPAKSPLWPDWQKQIVAVLLLILIPIGIYLIRPVLGPLVATFVLTFLLMYPVRLLQKLNLSYRGSALIVYFLFLILSMVAIGWFVVSAVVSLVETIDLIKNFVGGIADMVTGEAAGGLDELLQLDTISDKLKLVSVVGAGASLVASPTEFAASIVDRISRFTGFVSDYGFVVVLLLFMLLEWPRTVNLLGQIVPETSRREYSTLLSRIGLIGRNYIFGSFVIVLFYWVVTALLFAVTGVPHPIVLGLLVAIPNFIPQGGGLVSAILVFVLTLVTGSGLFAINNLLFAFIEMAAFMLISGVAYYFVDARIYSKAVNIPVWMVIVGIVVFAGLMGVVGAFIGAAAVAIIGEIIAFVLKKLRDEDPYPPEVESPPDDPPAIEAATVDIVPQAEAE